MTASNNKFFGLQSVQYYKVGLARPWSIRLNKPEQGKTSVGLVCQSAIYFLFFPPDRLIWPINNEQAMDFMNALLVLPELTQIQYHIYGLDS